MRSGGAAAAGTAAKAWVSSEMRHIAESIFRCAKPLTSGGLRSAAAVEVNFAAGASTQQLGLTRLGTGGLAGGLCFPDSTKSFSFAFRGWWAQPVGSALALSLASGMWSAKPVACNG